MQYVTLNPKEFPASATDAEVEKYYTEHVSEFETPRQVRAAHILARVPETGGSDAEDKARAKIADAIRRAKAGEDFGKLAQEISEDSGRRRHAAAIWAWWARARWCPQFEQALFALKKGEVSRRAGPHPVRLPRDQGGRHPGGPRASP